MNSLLPQDQKNQIYTKRAYFLYAFGMGHTIDLLNLIMDKMLITVKAKKPSLPYAMLVSEICRTKGVIPNPSWSTVEHFALLDKTSLKKSHEVNLRSNLKYHQHHKKNHFKELKRFTHQSSLNHKKISHIYQWMIGSTNRFY